MPHIPFCKELLKDEFEKTAWIEESGLSHEELENAVVNFKADYVETNGRIKPEWINDIEQ